MRLWSLHPRHLDRRGLVALWREALLAQAVLRGKTKGYRHHPQLERIRAQRDPVAAIGAYLVTVWNEAASRGYRFDRRKIFRPSARTAIHVTSGQLRYELAHLLGKLRGRDPNRYRALLATARLRTNPIFREVPGSVAGWERTPSVRET